MLLLLLLNVKIWRYSMKIFLPDFNTLYSLLIKRLPLFCWWPVLSVREKNHNVLCMCVMNSVIFGVLRWKLSEMPTWLLQESPPGTAPVMQLRWPTCLWTSSTALGPSRWDTCLSSKSESVLAYTLVSNMFILLCCDKLVPIHVLRGEIIPNSISEWIKQRNKNAGAQAAKAGRYF